MKEPAKIESSSAAAQRSPHGELTLDRWNYLFEVELRHSRQRCPQVEDSHAPVALTDGSLDVSAAHDVMEILQESPSSTAALQALVRLAVACYRVSSEGDSRYGRKWDYSQYATYDCSDDFTSEEWL